MCRNIKTLHNVAPPATDEEIRASAVQFVRKLSGMTKPAKANQVAFERAVDQVAAAALRTGAAGFRFTVRFYGPYQALVDGSYRMPAPVKTGTAP